MPHCNQTPLTADETQHDPNLMAEEARPHSQPSEAADYVPSSSERLSAAQRAHHPLHATGEHQPIRVTGTDQAKLEPIDQGHEVRAQDLSSYEPEDRRPDQLDRNK